MKHLLLSLLLLFPASAFAQHGHAPAKEPVPVALSSGLGDINQVFCAADWLAIRYQKKVLATLSGVSLSSKR